MGCCQGNYNLVSLKVDMQTKPSELSYTSVSGILKAEIQNFELNTITHKYFDATEEMFQKETSINLRMFSNLAVDSCRFNLKVLRIEACAVEYYYQLFENSICNRDSAMFEEKIKDHLKFSELLRKSWDTYLFDTLIMFESIVSLTGKELKGKKSLILLEAMPQICQFYDLNVTKPSEKSLMEFRNKLVDLVRKII